MDGTLFAITNMMQHSEANVTTMNQAPRSPCCLSNIPLDLWYSVLDFLRLSDLPRIFATNRELHELLDQDGTFERFATRKFPLETLQPSSYGGSWKRLVQDDNAENGVYIRRMCVISEWRYNRQYERLHYINAMRCMVWDKREKRIYLGIEAFGNRDLRPACTTSIFQLRGGTIQPRPLGQRLIRIRTAGDRRPPPLPELERRLHVEHTYTYPLGSSNEHQSRRGVSHDLCLLSLEDRWFEEAGCQYHFTYNGSLDSAGSDYECKLFLRDFTSLDQCFQLGHSSSFVGVNHCEFVSRSTPLLAPSNVLDWPNLVVSDEGDEGELQFTSERLLPASIKGLHARGEWGAIPPVAKAQEVPMTANNLRKLLDRSPTEGV